MSPAAIAEITAPAPANRNGVDLSSDLVFAELADESIALYGDDPYDLELDLPSDELFALLGRTVRQAGEGRFSRGGLATDVASPPRSSPGQWLESSGAGRG